MQNNRKRVQRKSRDKQKEMISKRQKKTPHKNEQGLHDCFISFSRFASTSDLYWNTVAAKSLDVEVADIAWIAAETASDGAAAERAVCGVYWNKGTRTRAPDGKVA